MDKWSEYQDYIQNGKFNIEQQNGELMLYHYFDTLQWGYRYAIVLNDNIILIGKEYPNDEWFGATEVYNIMTQRKNKMDKIDEPLKNGVCDECTHCIQVKNIKKCDDILTMHGRCISCDEIRVCTNYNRTYKVERQ